MLPALLAGIAKRGETSKGLPGKTASGPNFVLYCNTTLNACCIHTTLLTGYCSIRLIINDLIVRESL